MRKRKLRKAVTLAVSADGEARVYDRRATDLTRQADVAVVVIDDPMERGVKLEVIRNLRDDPLARMHSRRQIDDAQFAAGRKWQRHYEAAEGRGAGAIDPSKEAVDGGMIPEPFTDEKREAHLELIRACRVVGKIGESLLRDVLVERLFMHQVAEKRGQTSQRDIDGYAWAFRQALEALAVEWGFAMRSGLSTISSRMA